MTLSSTGANPKPVLDEGGFQQLLAAAYVLQQHNDSLHAKDPRLDAAWIFSQISEIENLVRQGELRLADAAKLVGDRICGITGAVSASICLLREGHADCVVETGVGAHTVGRSVAVSAPAALERLRNGRQFQSLDAPSDSRLDAATCSELGVRSLLAVPIQKSEETAGLIEVRWGLANAIHECDVRTCRLMANLLAEVLERNESVTEVTKQAYQAVIQSESEVPAAHASSPDTSAGVSGAKEHAASDLAAHCRVCGRPFSSDETFCGHCSMPRVAASANGEGLQSKWASMWFMQQAKEARPERKTGKFWPSEPKLPLDPTASSAKQSELPIKKSEAPAVPAFSAISAPPAKPAPLFPTQREIASSNGTPDYFVPEHCLRILEDKVAVDRGSEAPYTLLSRLRPLLSIRIKISRRTVALAICSVGAVLFLASWLSWPAQSSSHLSWFDSLLVDFGLAEVQARRPAPAYAGNPNVRVWEDVHTALYYCPDSDLYGKTPGGRFSTQRAAQEDQFEPATRIVCQ